MSRGQLSAEPRWHEILPFIAGEADSSARPFGVFNLLEVARNDAHRLSQLLLCQTSLDASGTHVRADEVADGVAAGGRCPSSADASRSSG